jgi:hypothetical protein
LDGIKFITINFKDSLDFKTIACLILDGKHLTEKGKKLIIKLGDSMNNNKLSTNSNTIILVVMAL